MTKILWIAGAGALGTLARYGLTGLFTKVWQIPLPFGTMAVNLAGCFIFGALWTVAEARALVGGEMRVAVFIGFLGAFTTFSTYIFETGILIKDSQWLYALGNITLQNLAGLASMVLGVMAARAVVAA